MWYKYLNRNVEDTRVWKRINLKFNQDDYGQLKNKNPSKLLDIVYRMARGQGPLRFCAAAIGVSVASILMWYSAEQNRIHGKERAEKAEKQKEETNRKARQTLWYNRFGVPARPMRTFDDLMTFIASEECMENISEYLGYTGTSNTYTDYQDGLDSWASDQDKKMLKYYKESLKYKSHH